MEPILTFNGSVEQDPEIARWLDAQNPALGSIARHWFDRLRASGPDVLEMLHDGFPYLCVRSAPFAYVNAFKAHVNVGFLYGALLEDPAGILQGTGRRGRHVKLRPDEETPEAALDALIEAAYWDVLERLANAPIG